MHQLAYLQTQEVFYYKHDKNSELISNTLIIYHEEINQQIYH